MNHNDTINTTGSAVKDKSFDIQQTNQKRPLLTKLDSVDLDCEWMNYSIIIPSIYFISFR